MKYTEFKPVILTDDIFVIDTLPQSDQFHKNIEYVFDFYNVKYKTEGSEILIPCALWEDQDLMWNYTSKAKDQEWINKH